MTNFDLLSAVQPATGFFAIVGIKDGGNVRQELVDTREDADAVVQKFVQQGRNAFFGVAKFKTDQGRTKDNVQSLKAFWLDIDCGEAKAPVNPKTGRPLGYIDQQTGISELKRFCKLIGLPKPILVNSGRGIHVYWPLEEDITREQWEPVAARLHQLCVLHNFYIDAQVFEVARVLRVPGTFNFKDDPPQQVEVISEASPVSFSALCVCLGMGEPQPKRLEANPAPKREPSELTKLLMDNSISRFSKIMRRSGAGEGCQQLWDSYKNQASLEEPRWFDALSIAKFCVDQQSAIHKMSSGYEGYDPDATEHKIKHILGPHTCDVFERNNPGGCEGCPFRGKIKSPIMLGKEVAEAQGEDYILIGENEGKDEEEVYVIPKYPEPYFRGLNGGIYMRPKNDEDDPILIYEDDVYAVKRMRDPAVGDVVLLRVHMPQDGVREFVVNYIAASDPGELRKVLAAEGVLCGKKRFDLLTDMLFACIDKIKHQKKAELMRFQYGWADNDSKFIIGDMEISKDGIFHSPPSAMTTNISKHMGPVGSYAKWKEVFSLYGRPGLEPHAFGALSAFGAPLLKFFGQNGAIINLIHPRSGTGKTTILHMCNSVYGSPDRLCAVKADTFNSKVLRLGVMCNLPFVIDEMTNMEAKEFSELAYNMSQGRGKDRVKSHSNELRENLTSWRTISLCSSNASFAEKLSAFKNSPDGELMRLMEYKIDYSNAIDTALAKQMFDHQLMENYGHAGPIFAQYLVNNLEEVRATCLSIQAKIDRELKLTQRERFWSATTAANITGGLIAKSLGIIDWDMKAIYKWATSMVRVAKEETEAPPTDAATVIGDYINRHIQNILVVNDIVDRRSKMPTLPSLEPRGELLIRYEPDTKKMFLTSKAFRDDCVKHQVNVKETLKQLRDSGALLGSELKRVSKGMKVASTGVQSLVLDCSVGDFIDVENFIASEIADGGGES
jgi:hypothetical protein